MKKALLETINDLTKEEKSELYEYLWNHFYNNSEVFPLSEEEKQILDKCLEEEEYNPNSGAPLKDVLKEIRSEK